MPAGTALGRSHRLHTSAEECCAVATRELAARRAASDLLHCSTALGGLPVAGPEVQTHVAAYPELVFVRQGLLDVVSPAGVIRLVPGRLLFIEPGVEHGEIHQGEHDAIFFDVHNTNVRFYRATTGWHETSIYLLGRTSLRYITDAISAELTDRDAEFETSVHGLLLHFACLLVRRIERGSYLSMPWIEDTVNLDKRAWLAVQRALGYLAAHLRDPINAPDVARAAGYSPGYLNRLFARFFGTSATACLRDLRMTHARDLLRNSNFSIAEIADRVGYTDPSNFRRAFVAATGVSVKAFRRGESDWLPSVSELPRNRPGRPVLSRKETHS
jgi:AraC-like DNA-binding protein